MEIEIKQRTCICNRQMYELNYSSEFDTIDSSTCQTIVNTIAEDLDQLEDYGEYIVQRQNCEKIEMCDLISKYGDLSWYEYNCNESWISLDSPVDCGKKVAFLFNCLANGLMKKYKGKVFYIVVSVDQGEYPNITAHYYQYRNNDKDCFHKDIDKFIQPFLYAIIGK